MLDREADGSLAIVVRSKGFNQHAKVEVLALLGVDALEDDPMLFANLEHFNH